METLNIMCTCCKEQEVFGYASWDEPDLVLKICQYCFHALSLHSEILRISRRRLHLDNTIERMAQIYNWVLRVRVNTYVYPEVPRDKYVEFMDLVIYNNVLCDVNIRNETMLYELMGQRHLITCEWAPRLHNLPVESVEIFDLSKKI